MEFKTIIQQKQGSFLDHTILRGFLRDCGVDKRTAWVMECLYEIGIVEKIRRSGGTLSQTEVYHFISQLEKDYGISPQFAEEGLRQWAYALDATVHTPAQPRPPVNTATPNPAPHHNPSPAPVPPTKPFYGSVLTKSDVLKLGWDKVSSLTIPNCVTKIDTGAFKECTSLTDIHIPNSVAEIGPWAFRGCTNLVNIAIPDGVTNIDDGTFADCTNLAGIIIPDSVTEIGHWAFKGCTRLVNVTIPCSVKYINSGIFQGCTSLTSVTIPNSVTYINSSAFQGCTSLATIAIPDSVTKIFSEAFQGCTKLMSVTLSKNCQVTPGAFPEGVKLTYYKQNLLDFIFK